MTPEHRYAQYVWIFLAITTAVLLPVVVLNYTLGARSLGVDTVLRASHWQQNTRGITYVPPLSETRTFKSARLFDRLPEINTVVFGSSTAMGITQGMFPEGMTIYNFAQTGNSLLTVIAEAEFLQRYRPRGLKWFVIPLDWSLGFVYQPGNPGRQELAPPTAEHPQQRTIAAIPDQLRDALSLPRVKNLLGIIKGIAYAESPVSAFRQMFLQEASEEYRCIDGTPAKDFDTIFRGTCTGFRYDGSATFANLERVPARRADALIASALVPSSKYAVEMIRTGGNPNPLLLERLATLAHEVRRTGGEVVLFLPPLLPGMERAFFGSPHTAQALRRTKQVLDEWAHAEGLIIIDAGQSERLGCAVQEFVDEHHALPECYARVFARFWSDRRLPAKVRPGLYSAVR